MQVAINLPSDFVAMQTTDVIEREMRISYALALFKAARVTLSKAAELADLNIYLKSITSTRLALSAFCWRQSALA